MDRPSDLDLLQRLAALPGGPVDPRPPTSDDLETLAHELGRPARGVLAVAHRCRHGVPASVLTAPRLPDGTPFPTLYYLTCSVLSAAVSRLESAGVMREMTARLAADPDLAQRYRTAHETYLATRDAVEDLGIAVTAGGMPDRVKCLHVLVAHTLAVGPGINPLGDDSVLLLPEAFRGEPPCVGPVPG
ncbi:DUF501 domain-containing protein [Nakamurella endophytica]|uniref:DUF501 domain-containing protein n=1 Tax=Nakamurella endophytica TaxID=1748367 RepID=A0A917SLU2_9ACTN|nr:DUF501 domain-containing protein [Nakamurella endophytica]GGL87208.1 hypothetical protein GCM10011594_03490 [Nakamurella endophytica]